MREEELLAEIAKLKEKLEESRVKYNLVVDACKELSLGALELIQAFDNIDIPTEQPLEDCIKPLKRLKAMTERLQEFE